MQPTPDAIVIGGGPAGSLTGLLLARAGWRVLLLEQHRFPRDKVCGECLSALGIEVLQRVGLGPLIERSAPVVLRRALIHPAEGPTVEVPLPRPMWGLTRRSLDLTMLLAAREAGVTVDQPARCERVLPGAHSTTVMWRRTEDNRQCSATAKWVVVADGKGAFPFAAPPATGDLGVKAHFENVDGPDDAIELFAGPGCYGGLAPVEDGSWNGAFAVPASLLRQCGNVESVIQQLRAFNSALARRLRGSVRIGRWLSAPLPRHAVRGDAPEGVVYVGNGSAALEPVGGEGMGLALRSAELGAAAIIAGRTDALKLPDEHRQLWALRRVACRAIGWGAARPSIASAASELAAMNELVTRKMASWAGKRQNA